MHDVIGLNLSICCFSFLSGVYRSFFSVSIILLFATVHRMCVCVCVSLSLSLSAFVICCHCLLFLFLFSFFFFSVRCLYFCVYSLLSIYHCLPSLILICKLNFYELYRTVWTQFAGRDHNMKARFIAKTFSSPRKKQILWPREKSISFIFYWKWTVFAKESFPAALWTI